MGGGIGGVELVDWVGIRVEGVYCEVLGNRWEGHGGFVVGELDGQGCHIAEAHEGDFNL